MADAAETPNPRKAPAPRIARKDVAKRERRILNALVAGVSAAELARREGVSVRRMQQVTRAIFARRRDAMPEDFVELQMTRLQEALLVSYSAMGRGNLKAVDRVVRIVRELDRYQGYTERGAFRLPRDEKMGAKQNGFQVLENAKTGETNGPLALSAPAAARSRRPSGCPRAELIRAALL